MTSNTFLIRFIFVFVVAVAVTSLGSAAGLRTWTDKTGKFKVEAEFVELKGATLVLKRKDGKRIEVPIARLSPVDQEVAKALMSAADENPFKTVDSPSSPPAAPSGSVSASPIKPGEVAEPSWESAIEVPLAAGDRWEIPPGDIPKLEFEPKIVGLPKKTGFFEGMNGFAMSAIGKRAAFSYSTGGRGGRQEKITTRIVMVDLATGRLLANGSIDGTYVVVALHDDGRQIVTEKTVSTGRSSRDKKYTLATLNAQGANVSVQDEWIPYSHVDEGSRHVRFAKFANNGKFVTCNEPGMVAVWDFATRKLDFHFRISRTSIPALSPDRRYVGYSGGNKVAFMNIETQEPVGMKAAPNMTFWVQGQFSPTGKRFAASSQTKLMIWDLETGEVLFEGGIPGLALAYGLRFPHDDFVLISKEYLVEWSSGIKVWQYTNAGRSAVADGTMFMVSDAVVPFKMPHAKALQMLEQAKAQSDLFVVKKGVSLAVDVSGVPSQYQSQVRESLEKQIAKIGCKVASRADVTVKANVSGPKKDSVSYFSAGSFQIDRYTSTVTFEFEGKKIWSSSQSNVPGALTSPREKSYQQQIDDAGSKPNLRFFGYVNLPEYLQKPSGTSGNRPGARPQQTLGVSKVSSNGVN